MKMYRIERVLVVVQDVMADNKKEAIELAEAQTNLAAMPFVDEVEIKVKRLTPIKQEVTECEGN